MDSKFGDEEKKIKTARECILLLTHLNFDDRFGLILFDNKSSILISMNEMCKIKYSSILKILKCEARGGTNMECGYNEAIKMFNDNNEWINDKVYENRMIFLTDACPNDGCTNPNQFIKLVENGAAGKSRIYTTFVGIGVDFNSQFISKVSGVRGCNYFSVDSKKKFYKKLHSEFDYFVSPMVFNLKLTLFCEGGDSNENGCIDQVFGDNNGNIDISSGEIMKISTLFASPPSSECDNNDIKGGIVLIKLKNEKIQQNKQYFIQTQFEDKFGKKYDNMTNIQFSLSSQSSSHYANLGVRKGLLLVRYVVLMKQWIKSNDKEKKNSYPKKLQQFRKYFEKEMKCVNDDSLKQEIDIINTLINW